MDVDTSVRLFKEGCQALEKFATGSQHWKAPLKMGPLKDDFKKALKVYKKGVYELGEVFNCAERLKEDGKAEDTHAKRTWKENRSKHEVYFNSHIGNAVPAVSRIIANCSYSKAFDPSEVGLDPQHVYRELQCSADSTKDDVFECSCGTTPVDASAAAGADGLLAPATFWHGEVERFIAATLAPAEKAGNSAETKFSNKPDQGAVASVMEATAKFAWVDASGDSATWFVQPEIRPFFWAGRSQQLDLTRTGNPVVGLVSWLFIYKGSVSVTILSACDLQANPDVSAWLLNAEVRELQLNMTTIAPPGCAVFIPAGCQAVLVGLPSEKELTTRNPKLAERGRKRRRVDVCTDSFVIGVSVNLDPNLYLELSAPVKRGLAARWLENCVYLPKCVREHAEAKAWVDAMNAEPTG